MVKMFKRANGRLYLEYKLNGKKVQKSTGLSDTPQNRTLVKKEVIPALERKLLLGEIGKESPKNFSYYADIFIEDKKHLKTYNRVQMHVATAKAAFGEIPINQLKRSHIKAWIREMLNAHSPKTVRNYLSSVRGIIDIAIDQEVITTNVAHNLKLPSHHSKEVEPFTSEQVRLLLEKSEGFLKRYLAVGFYTGMRTGEILGLMYSDIDFDNKVIHVRRSVVEGVVSTPKTYSSIREVPLLDDLIPYLKKPSRSLWLFAKPDGSRVNRFGENRYRQWRSLLSNCGLPYRKPYVTRHTFIVSMLKHSDLSILQIAQIAGHTTTQMIIQNYGKYIKGEHLKVDRDLRLFTDKSADSAV